ncbi:hypothetical protein LTR53_016137 [Teratosphaeriaceae sp. CCFEE 6253]|nr:hypothetical protein LTR53_016137 [Teratosphaeriaceae sp. CCFEE 6253]
MGLFSHHDKSHDNLSPEDRKILEQAHGNLDDHEKQIVKESYTQKDNPDHPANPNHKDVRVAPSSQTGFEADLTFQHEKFKGTMGKVSNKLGNAAIFGFGASAGSALFNNIF